MIDPAGAIAILPSAPLDGRVVEAGAATAPDVARLQLALSDAAGSPQVAPAQVPAEAAGPSIAKTPLPSTDSTTAAPRTLGDVILQGLQSASTDITQAWRATGEVLNKPELSVSDMLRVQTMLLQSAVQYELVGKAVSKSTQSLENILKTQ